VGAPLYDNGDTDEGAAFVFLGSASGIANGNPATAAAVLESNQASAHLGISVAGAGDVNGDGYADVIVGSPLYDKGETDEGAAFVFLGSASGIANGNPATAAAVIESNQAGGILGDLGFSVAGAGDVNGDGYSDVIVGAPFYSDGSSGEGAAFVFLGSASGIANGNPATAAAVLESNQANAQLGYSVAGAGDVNGDGYADVIVGSPFYDDGLTDEGAAFVFLGSASGIANGTPATAAAALESNQVDARLGISVASAGDVNGDGYADVIAGAHFYDNGQADEGAAFVYLGGGSGIADGGPSSAATSLTSSTSPWYGFSVASAGDVNGDGYSDVIVGAPYFDAGETDEGAAFVFLGGSAGIASGDTGSAATQLESNQTNGSIVPLGFEAYSLGYVAVASAGDVNGDGYGDVIVGFPGYDDGQTDEGAAFIFLGSATGIPNGNPSTAATRLESNQVSTGVTPPYFGASVASAGDVNGDGYGDVIVGAAGYSNGQTNEGAAFVFLGSPSGVADGNPATAATVLESNQASAFLGFNVASAGDVNGDGYADVIVGASSYDNGQTDEGAAFVFLGSPTGIASGNPATAAAVLESNQDSAQFGSGVAGAGDVNGDGYADVIVGASMYDNGQTDEGAAFVFLGSPTGIASGNPSTADARLESNQTSAELGWSVAGAGDVNGDGYADVIVGAPYYSNGQTNEGVAFVFPGGPSGVGNRNPGTAMAQIESNVTDSAVVVTTGTAIALPRLPVASAGDVNGDGFADVIVGFPGYPGFSGSGLANVYLGNSNRSGRPVLERQASPTGSPPRQPWSYVADSLQVSLRATRAEGRGRVRLESQWCPPAVEFGDPSCGSQVSPSWVDVTATSAGVTLADTISGLDSGVLYRWRARVLSAPLSVTAAGITPPAKPAHGPWRRPTAQSVEADVRALPEPEVALSLATGAALLAALARHRGRRERAR